MQIPFRALVRALVLRLRSARPPARAASRAACGARAWSATLLVLCLVAAGGVAAQAQSQSQSQSSREVTLNFKDADIRQIIEAVAEATGKNFIIDSRVKGPVTLISKTPLDADAVYEVFLSVLQVNGFIAVPSGNVIKILPDTNARQVPAKDLPGALSSSSDAIVTQVIEVKNVGAAQLVPILRPLVPQYGHLAAHPASNTLIISDRESNVYRMLRIIARIDQASDDDIEVIPLQHASAGDLVRVLTALSQAGGRGGEGAPMASTLVADERTNSVLLGGEKSERLRFRTLIAHLDTPLESGGDTQVIYLRYADAEELATKLKEQITGVAATQTGGGGGGQAAPAPPSQQGNAIIWADAPTNSLVITAPPKIMRNLRSVIDKLDIRRAQVKLEAFIADISLERTMELGFQFAVDGTDNAASAGLTNFSSSGLGIVDLAGIIASGGSGEALSGVPDGLTGAIGKIRDDSTSFALLINALRGDGSTNILSIPTVVTMDNEEAQLSVGQQVPFLTGSFTNTGVSGGVGGTINPFQTIQRQDVGLTLKVTPQINEGSAVVLEINLEVSSLAQGAAGAVDLITNRRTVSQKVVVEDGGVVVLGGLIDDSLTEGEQRVPGLGRIPIIGNLFKSRNTEKVKRNLMVFIQPKILRDGLQAAYETNSKYEYIRNLQLREGQPVQLMREEQRPLMPPLESIQHPGLLNPPPPAPGPVLPWVSPQTDEPPPEDETSGNAVTPEDAGGEPRDEDSGDGD
jgi:general secretion pathway protein D